LFAIEHRDKCINIVHMSFQAMFYLFKLHLLSNKKTLRHCDIFHQCF